MLEYLISLRAYTSPTIPHTIVTTAEPFWMNGSFDGCVLQEISGNCVETKPRGIEAAFIISGNRGQPHVSLRFQCEQRKPWQWPANKAMAFLCVRVYKHN